jgi:hypothetical protein
MLSVPEVSCSDEKMPVPPRDRALQDWVLHNSEE